MKPVLAIVFTLCIPVLSWCQADHFIYLQTDYKQPFYVRINNKVYSSSESGHLILGKLEDSVIQLVIGFPKNTFEEQQFKLPVKTDAGFLLKNFGEEGWGLFNLQTLELIKNSNQPQDKKTSSVGGIKKTDAFSVMLANAVNDTAVLYTSARPPSREIAKLTTPVADTPMVKEEKKPAPDTMSVVSVPPPKKDTPQQTAPIIITTAPAPEIIKKDTNTIVAENKIIPVPVAEKDTVKKYTITPNPEPVLVENKKDSISPPVTNLPAPATGKIPVTVFKAAEILTDTSYIAVFVDSLQYDTVRVSIPFDERKLLPGNHPPVLKEEKQLAKASETIPTRDTLPATVKEENPVVKKADSLPPKIVEEKALPVTPKPVNNSEKTTNDTVPPPVITPKENTPAPVIDTAATTLKKKMAIPNTDCKIWASENDVDKLRVKMLAQKTDDDKLMTARKIFKQRCFSTRQIKGLSELFITEEGIYRWLDTAYPFVSDPSNFETAIDLLKDEYYINRFKAMIRHIP
jgi:hypothetical protein